MKRINGIKMPFGGWTEKEMNNMTLTGLRTVCLVDVSDAVPVQKIREYIAVCAIDREVSIDEDL